LPPNACNDIRACINKSIGETLKLKLSEQAAGKKLKLSEQAAGKKLKLSEQAAGKKLNLSEQAAGKLHSPVYILNVLFTCFNIHPVFLNQVLNIDIIDLYRYTSVLVPYFT